MIRTLIVDDSAAFRATLRAVLTPAAGFDIVGEAADGAEAVAKARAHRPTLVVMDVVMPQMDGLSATRALMVDTPCAVVVVSGGLDQDSQALVFEALRSGAVEVLQKPRNLHDPAERQKFCDTLRAMAGIKVVRRRPEKASGTLVVVGASTGGPPALETMVRQLPNDFSVPVVIAQHLAIGFVVGLQRWLKAVTRLDVKVVDQPAALAPGVYLALDGHHVEVDAGKVLPVKADVGTLSPSVDKLFASAVRHQGPVIAVLLTGMGADGSEGLAAIRAHGGHTIVQDEATSLVYGMPRTAAERGAAVEVLPLNEIGRRIVQLAGGPT